MEDAKEKLDKLLVTPRKNTGKLADWTSGTIDRCLDIIYNNREAEKWYRNYNTYRNNIYKPKY
jgi:hypothetical protein